MRLLSSLLVRRLTIAIAAVIGPSLWIVPSASAATPSHHIQSTGPLSNIWAGNDLSCQAGTSSDSRTEFFPGSPDVGDCGTFLSVTGNLIPGGLFGPDFSHHGAGSRTGFTSGTLDYTAFAPVSQSAVTGNGTQQTPYQVTTVVTATQAGASGSSLHVTLTQTDSYVVGNDFYSSTVTVANAATSETLNGRIVHAGDCFLRGLPTGFGAVIPFAAPTTAACTLNAENQPASSLEVFLPQTAGNHFVENQFAPVTGQNALQDPPNGQIWPDVDTRADLPDGCDCLKNEDNAMGIDWPVSSLAPGQSASFSWRTQIDIQGAPSSINTGTAQPTSPTTARLTGSGVPDGNATTGHFIYGVDRSDRGPGFNGNVYDQSTPSQNMGSGFSSQSISFPVSGLLPNTKYDVKFVASNSAGTTTGPNQTFTTPRARVSAIPPLGSENFSPSGKVFVLLNGKFVKLTQTMQLPSGTEVDALQGSLTLVANSGAGGGKASDARARKPKKPKTFTGTFSGAVFKVIQTRRGPNRGLTTIALVDQTPPFPGARSYATTCKARRAADGSWQTDISRRVLYTLRSRSRGRWGSRGRYAAGTVGGTVWTITDRCDGTLITARIDTVLVRDLVRHIKILLRAGQHYLALAHPHRTHK